MSKWKEEKAYLYISLLFGVLFLLLTPPFQSPDEDSHFKKSYQISKGNLYSEVEKNRIGDYFPNDMLNYIEDKLTFIGDRDQKYSFSEMVADQYAKMNYEDQKFSSYSTATIMPLAYTAPSLGIVVSKVAAKIFDLDMVSTSYMLYFARAFSLLLSVFLTYLAIKITPVFKKTFVVISLLPMVLFLASMVTYDNILNSLTLLALALILRLTYDKELKTIPKKYFIALAAIGIVLLNVKTIYFLIFLLMFLIPVKKFKDKKGMIKTALILIGIILGATILLKLPTLLQKVSSSDSDLVGQQISYVLSHPWQFLVIIWNNIINQRFFQLNSMVGLFGLIDTYLPFVAVCGIYLYLILIALAEGSSDSIKIKKSMKIMTCIVVVISVIAIYGVMYISWTPQLLKEVGGDQISGVQGRYFLPLLMPLLLLFSNKKIKDNRIFKAIRKNYLIVPIVMLTISVTTILLRYWA